jgi:hypothetical protein
VVKVHRQTLEELVPVGSGSNLDQRSWGGTVSVIWQDSRRVFRYLKGVGGQDA